MKTEMKMLDNGNYESVEMYIQHECRSEDYSLRCIQYLRDMNNLHLRIEQGDPYEDGVGIDFLVKFCPFCGYDCNK